MGTTTAKKSKKKQNLDILTFYMEHLLEHGETPKSIYKFCKLYNLTEAEFYEQFGSFEALEQHIWVSFHDHTISLLEKQGREEMTAKEQLLTYYFTLFEMLTANRSYCLMVLDFNQKLPKNLYQLNGLRKKMKSFSKTLIKEGNDEKSTKFIKHPESIFSEAIWVQFLFLLRFWIKDNSKGFEKTDIAIEKSVQTAFEVFETKPLESLIDFGKFLWNEYKS